MEEMELKMEEIMKALYFQWKRMIIQFYKLDKLNSDYSSSFIYAISSDCYPLFHENEESKIYEKFFKIDKEFVKNVLKRIDDLYLKKEQISYYDLENEFGGRNSRINLITVLRYALLDNRFDNKIFWEKIKENGPSEIQGINNELEEWEI